MNHSEKLIILSGHFNPLHEGHLSMIEDGASLGEVCVIVKNDEQQLQKKGKIIRTEDLRLSAVMGISAVSFALLASDSHDNVCETLRELATLYPDRSLVFANGGDTSDPKTIPETGICEELGIDVVVGLGGFEKIESSTRINAALGVG